MLLRFYQTLSNLSKGRYSTPALTTDFHVEEGKYTALATLAILSHLRVEWGCWEALAKDTDQGHEGNRRGLDEGGQRRQTSSCNISNGDIMYSMINRITTVVVQSLSCVRLFVTHGLQHARLPCPSPTPRACSNSCPLSRWCHPTISSSVGPFSSCLESFPVSRFFPMSQFFTSGGQSIQASASASVLPMNIQDWFPLGLAGLISLKSKQPSGSLFQHHSSKASILRRSYILSYGTLITTAKSLLPCIVN